MINRGRLAGALLLATMGCAPMQPRARADYGAEGFEKAAAFLRQADEQRPNPTVEDLANKAEELASTARVAAAEQSLAPFCSHIPALTSIANFEDVMADRTIHTGNLEEGDRQHRAARKFRDIAAACQEAGRQGVIPR